LICIPSVEIAIGKNMGVYVIKSKHTNWFKVGHHRVSQQRPNVYYRYIKRGFYSCISPSEIRNRLSFDDVELLCWFPNLNEASEKTIHNLLSARLSKYGEWFKTDDHEIIVNIIKNVGGVQQEVLPAELDQAREWAKGARLLNPTTDHFVPLVIGKL
jgi:hypothetical protein